jgi:bloom syndrome protein
MGNNYFVSLSSPSSSGIIDGSSSFIQHEDDNPMMERLKRQDFEWSNEVNRVLLERFGHREFRHNQLQIINCILSRHDCFVLMPTGGGKSLCYQLPAVILEGVTIVVCPLISLIQDQVAQLTALDVYATFLASTQEYDDSVNVLRELSRRPPLIKLLYVTPEKIIRSNSLFRHLQQLYEDGMLSLFVIDEAHCVSQWGHDFRKDYTQLCILKQQFSNVPMVGLTATASEDVREDCVGQLRMKQPFLFHQSFNRENLRYEVRHKTSKSLEEIINMIKEKYPNQCGIIYCLSQKECEEVAQMLRKSKIRAAHYHASMQGDQRTSTQQSWSNGETQVICATIAFGMGINKHDVRFVIHYSLPKTLEGYYQESGRAGRDGKVADCVLYSCQRDKVRMLYVMNKDGARAKEPMRKALRDINEVLNYCDLEYNCQRLMLLSSLGEVFDSSKCNKTCQNCKNRDLYAWNRQDYTQHAINILRMVESMPKRLIHIKDIVEQYKGWSNTTNSSKKAKQNGYGKCYDNFGKGKDLSKILIERIIQLMVY